MANLYFSCTNRDSGVFVAGIWVQSFVGDYLEVSTKLSESKAEKTQN
jgi:hypothetical protein